MQLRFRFILLALVALLAIAVWDLSRLARRLSPAQR